MNRSTTDNSTPRFFTTAATSPPPPPTKNNRSSGGGGEREISTTTNYSSNQEKGGYDLSMIFLPQLQEDAEPQQQQQQKERNIQKYIPTVTTYTASISNSGSNTAAMNHQEEGKHTQEMLLSISPTTTTRKVDKSLYSREAALFLFKNQKNKAIPSNQTTEMSPEEKKRYFEELQLLDKEFRHRSRRDSNNNNKQQHADGAPRPQQQNRKKSLLRFCQDNYNEEDYDFSSSSSSFSRQEEQLNGKKTIKMIEEKGRKIQKHHQYHQHQHDGLPETFDKNIMARVPKAA